MDMTNLIESFSADELETTQQARETAYIAREYLTRKHKGTDDSGHIETQIHDKNAVKQYISKP
jgi:hypothetical protein